MEGNKVRDLFVTRELRKMGWKVVRVWEHELKSPLRWLQNYIDILIKDGN